jgi:AraC-like DNA-binding protein
MLADRHISIHQIAYQLGYSDTTAFIRAFRRTGGITPALYRDRNG